MAVKILLDPKGGGSVRIRLSAGRSSDLVVDVGSADTVNVVVGQGLDEDAVSMELGNAARRIDGERYRALGQESVSREMVAAAINAFLARADTARLGRSLTDVYLAMEAARRLKSEDDRMSLEGAVVYRGPEGDARQHAFGFEQRRAPASGSIAEVCTDQRAADRVSTMQWSVASGIARFRPMFGWPTAIAWLRCPDAQGGESGVSSACQTGTACSARLEARRTLPSAGGVQGQAVPLPRTGGLAAMSTLGARAADVGKISLRSDPLGSDRQPAVSTMQWSVACGIGDLRHVDDRRTAAERAESRGGFRGGAAPARPLSQEGGA